MCLHWPMWADAQVLLEAFHGEVKGIGIDVTKYDDGLIQGQGFAGSLEEVVLWHVFVQVNDDGA